jgi:hypothetical protein
MMSEGLFARAISLGLFSVTRLVLGAKWRIFRLSVIQRVIEVENVLLSLRHIETQHSRSIMDFRKGQHLLPFWKAASIALIVYTSFVVHSQKNIKGFELEIPPELPVAASLRRQQKHPRSQVDDDEAWNWNQLIPRAPTNNATQAKDLKDQQDSDSSKSQQDDIEETLIQPLQTPTIPSITTLSVILLDIQPNSKDCQPLALRKFCN